MIVGINGRTQAAESQDGRHSLHHIPKRLGYLDLFHTLEPDRAGLVEPSRESSGNSG
jgi:hypothetical protein